MLRVLSPSGAIGGGGRSQVTGGTLGRLWGLSLLLFLLAPVLTAEAADIEAAEPS